MEFSASRFTESKIISILKQHESGLKLGDICTEHGISQATFFNGRAKYGGMSSFQLKRLMELVKEKSQLKNMVQYGVLVFPIVIRLAIHSFVNNDSIRYIAIVEKMNLPLTN